MRLEQLIPVWVKSKYCLVLRASQHSRATDRGPVGPDELEKPNVVGLISTHTGLYVFP